MNTLSSNACNSTTDLEYELNYLTKEYETQGFIHHFYLENGQLVCSDYNLALDEPVINIHENRYYPQRQGIPFGFCLYAITVRNAADLFKGIFLLRQGFLAPEQVSVDVDRQLQLNYLYPQLFKEEAKS
ncbi:MAG TPA: hypothetical protein VM802_22335 [Chitinophaga sp.]|uniref:hypothetical protein n=1 Tax=Chitinophaga sp. TaxID=1869181 RepID=UPI002C7A3731|nr:hypothetical protein [Chitinophaga sp.]HVI47626.1 hypothetical protein [Chitinophaga sp.]